MPMTIAEGIRQFAVYEVGLGLSRGTAGRRTGSLHVFMRTCQAIKGPLPTMGQIDHGCISAHFAALGGGQGNRNNHIDALRCFLRWGAKFGYLRGGFTVDGLMGDYKTRKAVRKPKIYVPAGRFTEALDAAEAVCPRDRAMLAVMLYTLARQGEVSHIHLRHVDLDGLNIQLYREKTGRYTSTGIEPEFHAELARWLDSYAAATGCASVALMLRDHPDWYLIPARPRGRQWRTTDVRPEVPLTLMERQSKAILAALEYTDLTGEGAHTWRRSGARAMFLHLRDALGHDGALVWAKNMLDHETTQMTLQYIGMDQEKEALNTWLKGNSMYGAKSVKPESNVVPFRARRGA